MSVRGALIVWIILVTLTVFSALTRYEHLFSDSVASTAIIGVAALKCFAVAWFFMEVRLGPRQRKIMLGAWTGVVCAMVLSYNFTLI